jgi:PAS domain S-box-containing protein
MWMRALLCLLLSIGGLPVWGLGQQSIDPALDHSAVQARYAYWYSDQTNDLAEVLALEQAQWTDVESLGSYGLRGGEYWIHLSLSQPALSSGTHIVRFIHPVHDVVDIHVLSEFGEKLNEWHIGDTVKNIQRPVQDKKPSFSITLDEYSRVDVYIRVSGINAMLLTMEVLSERNHQTLVQTEVLVSGLMYGILLVMMLYNLAIAISIRDKTYFIYVGYVASYILFILALTGDGYYYFWSNSPNFNSWLMPFIAGFLMIPSALFPIYLLNVKKYAAKLLPIYYILIFGSFIYLIAMPFLGAAESLKLVNKFSIIASITVLLTGIYLSIKKVPVALIYTVSWFILLSGLAALPLSSLGIIESSFFSRHANMLGGVVESILLSLALAHRIQLERQERVIAIQQSLVLKEELAENRKMFQELFDYAPIGMFRFSASGELVAVNHFLAQLIGYDHPDQVVKIGADIRNIFDTGHELATKVLKHEPVIDQESTLTTMSGEIRICSVTLRSFTQNNIEVVEGFISDITARKEAEQAHEIFEAERMTTMEQLVTGVAHEINTPLGNNVVSVSHLSELLANIDGKMNEGDLTKAFFSDFVNDSQSLMAIMSTNLEQITSLVKRFKLISVNQMDIEKVNFNFKQQVENVIDYYYFKHDKNSANKDIRVNVNDNGYSVIDSYPEAWKVILDQLLENSLFHGFIQGQAEKIIGIDLNYKNETWIVSYQDNGKGVSEEILKRIFDPFVTSRRGSQENAGLGMYRVYNIVHQVLKGQVNVEAGQGFKMVIEFK